MKTSILILIAVVVVVVLVGGYFLLAGTGTPASSTNTNTNNPAVIAPAGETYTAQIIDYTFVPMTLNVKVGDTVVWTNKDTVSHTVTSDSGSELNSASMPTGQTYSHTFSAAGTYNYHCTIHPMMNAKVVVTA